MGPFGHTAGVKSLRFEHNFDVTEPEAGGAFVATCREMPMVVAANSESDLRRRVTNAIDQLSKFLDELGRESEELLRHSGGAILDAAVGGTANSGHGCSAVG